MEILVISVCVSFLFFLLIFELVQSYKTQKVYRNTLDSIETSLRCIKNHYINK